MQIKKWEVILMNYEFGPFRKNCISLTATTALGIFKASTMINLNNCTSFEYFSLFHKVKRSA